MHARAHSVHVCTHARTHARTHAGRNGQSTGERVDGEQMVGSGWEGGGTAIRAEHIVGLCRRAVWECVCRGVCEAVRLFGASGGFLKKNNKRAFVT